MTKKGVCLTLQIGRGLRAILEGIKIAFVSTTLEVTLERAVLFIIISTVYGRTKNLTNQYWSGYSFGLCLGGSTRYNRHEHKRLGRISDFYRLL